MKFVSKLDIDFAWIVVMEAAEGDAVVDQEMAVGDVEGRNGYVVFFAERFAHGNIERGVLREVIAREKDRRASRC